LLQAAPFFCGDILQHRVVQHRVGQQLLQPCVLILELSQPARLGDVHAAEFRFPLVERRFADAVLAAHIRRLRSRLLLAQDPDDLPLGKT